MTSLVGRKLGKFEMVEHMARGGMAEVYKAFQPGVARYVVIKVLHSHLSGTETFVERFRREARAIGRLQHPHIVRIIDVGEEAGCYYMVMDFVQGGTLGEVLKHHGKMTVRDSLRIGLQLADALRSAHAQGVLHRDIKPSNLLFVDDTYSQIVLTDFGLASLADEAELHLTLTGTLVGTPTYMSPEAVLGERCDARSDIYSLGVVLYEMITGRPPYLANTPYSMMVKQASEPMPALRTLDPAIPELVEALVMKALAKDPDERFQCAAQLADAISHAQQALCDERAPQARTPEPVRVQPALSTQRTGSRTRRWLSLSLALSGIAVVALLTVELLLHL